MRCTLKLLSVAVLVWLVSVPVWAQDRTCEVVLGSLAAQLAPGTGWVGQGYLAFGHDDPIVTNLVDVGEPGKPNKAGGLSGTEKLTFTVPDTADALVMDVSYRGSASPVPFRNEYIGTGSISGTGSFAGVTGTVNIHGQYVFDPQIFTGPPRAWPFVWMAEIHGVICGRK